MTRDEILSRIRKLSRMTTENGCSEAEAALANAKLSALLEEHNLTVTEAQLREDSHRLVEDEFCEINATRDNWLVVCGPIAKLFHCQAYSTSRTEDSLGLGILTPIQAVKYFGFETDVAAAIAMTQICFSAIRHGVTTFSQSTRGKRKAQDFELGMGRRLAERIRELAPKAAPATGQALMVVKDQLVTDAFAQHLRSQGIRLGKSRGREAGNSAAYSAGQSAGSNVDLNAHQKVSGTRALTYRG
jgi:hypothetical protein